MSDEVEGYAHTVARLLDGDPSLSPLGRAWRQRAVLHLTERFDAALRGGAPRFSTEAQALSLLKSAARDLRAASSALQSAAQRLRDKGDAFGANQAHTARRTAADAADELDPN